jgi:activator of HSP90 ATPase
MAQQRGACGNNGRSAGTGFASGSDAFTAWGDYIDGRNIALEPGRRVVQAWRTAEFATFDPDSQIELLLEPVAGGTKVKLTQTNVPDGHRTYREGWQMHYLDTMKAYFGTQTVKG